MDKIQQILHGDCLELMKNIPDKSIDMILADLPYGNTENKWDSVIPLELMWMNYERIVKNNAAIILTSMQPFTAKLICSNLSLFKYELIWEKTRPNGHLEAKNKPMRKHENILVFSKGNSANGCKNRITYNPQNIIKVEKYNKNSSDTDNYGKRKSRPIGLIVKQEYTNYPTTILKFNSESKTIHPTQKPVALFEYLIKTYTNENDLVLDNTAGSGTTAVACLKTNRQFIVMEKEQKYIDIIHKRVKEQQEKYGIFNRNTNFSYS